MSPTSIPGSSKPTSDHNADTTHAEAAFVLQMYNRFWDIINAKDARIWTYLGFYGIALALIFGLGKQSPATSFLVPLVLLILTTWACVLIVSANWWFTRNLLFVAKAEMYFAEPQTKPVGSETDRLGQIVPAEYRDPPFQFESAYRASFGFFALLWLIFFLFEVIRLVLGDEQLDSPLRSMLF